MIRETVPSNCSRVMFDWKVTSPGFDAASTVGTGSRSRSRICPILSTARA
jgi:hypothetical protein